MTTTLMEGTWLSNVPLDANEGAKGDVLLEVALAIDSAMLQNRELLEEPIDGFEKPYREFLLPARMINRHSAVREVPFEEEDGVEPDASLPPRLEVDWDDVADVLSAQSAAPPPNP